MSYNKLKSLVANVEAIKTALQIHIQGRQATPEEKETLSQYSGFGGIKEVLIPEENVKDLEEVPENVKEGLVIRPVRTIDEVFQYGLSKQPEALPQTIEQPITAKQQIEVGTSATGSTARN